VNVLRSVAVEITDLWPVCGCYAGALLKDEQVTAEQTLIRHLTTERDIRHLHGTWRARDGRDVKKEWRGF
jgi:hypothetical protein